MVKVYFERNGYAEEFGTFISEDRYNQLLPLLEKLAKDDGFDRVTESIEHAWEINASYYLSGGNIAEQVEAIASHHNQLELIDNIEGVEVWQPLEGMYNCEEFLLLIRY